VLVRVVYDQVRVGETHEMKVRAHAIEALTIYGWEPVGRWKEHRPGARYQDFRSTDERGETLARMFIWDPPTPRVCAICDHLLDAETADARWTNAHADCVTTAHKLIGFRRPDGGMGKRGAWGLSAIRVETVGEIPAGRRFWVMQHGDAWFVEDRWEREEPIPVAEGRFRAVAIAAGKNGKAMPEGLDSEEAALFRAMVGTG